MLRVAEDPPHLEFERDLVAWTLAMGHAMIRAALAGLLADWRPDVVHAHDWLVAHPAIALADRLGVPLVATMHATEAGRHSGWLSQPLNRQVHSVEWWLANRADAVITCSAAMRTEVSAACSSVDPDDVTVMHNGIEPRRWRVRPAEVAATGPRTAPDGAPLIFYFGRLEYEKGVQDLIAALPRIRRPHPGTRLLVAGRGGHAPEFWSRRPAQHRVRRSVDFLGHLPDARAGRALRRRRRGGAAQPLRAVRHRRAGGGRRRGAAGGLDRGRARRGRASTASPGVSFAPGDVAGIADAVSPVPGRPDRGPAPRARGEGPAGGGLRLVADRRGHRRGVRVGDAPAARRPGRPKIPTGNVLGRS